MKFYFQFEIVETLWIQFFWTQSVGKVRRNECKNLMKFDRRDVTVYVCQALEEYVWLFMCLRANKIWKPLYTQIQDSLIWLQAANCVIYVKSNKSEHCVFLPKTTANAATVLFRHLISPLLNLRLTLSKFTDPASRRCSSKFSSSSGRRMQCCDQFLYSDVISLHWNLRH
jgi:hypothetical protein